MHVEVESDSDELLEPLLEDFGGLCGVSKVVLSLGDQIIATWSHDGSPDASCVIVNESIAVGVDGYQLTLLDLEPRELTASELKALRALGRTLQRLLADRLPKPQKVDVAWVSDHVAVALDYVTDSFLLLQADWVIQHVNTQFERFARKSRDEILGCNFWDAFPVLVGTAFEGELRSVMGSTLARVFEEFNELLGRWLEHRVYPCADGMAVLTIDFTERKTAELAEARTQQKLNHVQRVESLGTLASGIAHDFNNVLGAILGNAGMLAERMDAQPPDLQDLVQQIRIAGTRGRERARRVLTFGRKAANETLTQGLRPAIEESLALLRATLPGSVELREKLSAADEPLYATVNATDVQQLVINLCTNSWQSLAAKGGYVEVRLTREVIEESREGTAGELRPGAYANLSVADNGSGMAANVREHLFEPFFTTKPRGSGSGLGLYVVHEIVASYGGAIEVKSAPGMGTTVSLYLPLEVTPGAAAQVLHDQPRVRVVKGANNRIACVDDDEVVLLMMERLLTLAGFQVTSFGSPYLFLEQLKEDGLSFDLLVTDYSMPGMNGLELVRKVRAAFPALPVVVNSGLVSDDLGRLLADSAITSVVNKERTYEDLPMEVARLLYASEAHLASAASGGLHGLLERGL